MSPRPPGHRVLLFEEDHQTSRWRYVCQCQVRGPWRATPSQAADDLTAHYAEKTRSPG